MSNESFKEWAKTGAILDNTCKGCLKKLTSYERQTNGQFLCMDCRKKKLN